MAFSLLKRKKFNILKIKYSLNPGVLCDIFDIITYEKKLIENGKNLTQSAEKLPHSQSKDFGKAR